MSQPGPSQTNHPQMMTPLSWSCFTPPDLFSLKTCLQEVETSHFSTATFSSGSFSFLKLSLKLPGTTKAFLERSAPEEPFGLSLPKCFHQDGKTERPWGQILSQQPHPPEARPETALVPIQASSPSHGCRDPHTPLPPPPNISSEFRATQHQANRVKPQLCKHLGLQDPWDLSACVW